MFSFAHVTTRTEENYLKAIYKLGESAVSRNAGGERSTISTNAIAGALDTRPASVTDMLKRLSKKRLIQYTPYHGVTLTDAGRDLAVELLRRHRLWEVFLVEKLGYDWGEIHELAEELEHVGTSELTDRLDQFLEFPRFDPHGDPIPNTEGKFTLRQRLPLSELSPGSSAIVTGVREHSKSFLAHLNELRIALQTEVVMQEHLKYDDIYRVLVESTPHTISAKVAQNILVKPLIQP